MSLIPLLRGKAWASKRRWSEEKEDELLVSFLDSDPASGFYLDIGANLPMKRSNTYRLHCLGMRGLCIEPNIELASLFELIRPKDDVLCAAIAPEPGVTTFQPLQLPRLFHLLSGRKRGPGR